MVITGPFVLFLIVALVSLVLAVTMKSWIAKLIFFIIALGAATIAASIIVIDVGWVLLVNVVLFLATGLSSIRIRNTGNRILGIVFIILGIMLIFPSIQALGYATPGTVLDAIVESFQQGWQSLMDTLQRVFGGT